MPEGSGNQEQQPLSPTDKNVIQRREDALKTGGASPEAINRNVGDLTQRLSSVGSEPASPEGKAEVSVPRREEPMEETELDNILRHYDAIKTVQNDQNVIAENMARYAEKLGRSPTDVSYIIMRYESTKALARDPEKVKQDVADYAKRLTSPTPPDAEQPK